jgi:hypothetical protein
VVLLRVTSFQGMWMEIAIEISDGQDNELEQVRDALRGQDITKARIVLGRGSIKDGALGAEQVLLFIGQDVALPLVVHALYDYLTRRRRTLSASRLRIALARTDLPGGVHRAELTIEGPADEVVEAVCKELE